MAEGETSVHLTRAKKAGKIFLTFLEYIFEIAAFFLFLLGTILEIIQDAYFIDALFDEAFSDLGINAEKVWLVVLIVLYIMLFITVSVLLCCLTCCKLCAIACGKEQAGRILGVISEHVQLIVVLVAFWKLMIYGSILNKFRIAGLWSGTDDSDLSSISPYWLAGYNIPQPVPSGQIGLNLKDQIRQTAFNMFRTTWLYFPVVVIESESAIRKIIGQIVFLIPSLGITILIFSKPFTSLLVFHFSQRKFLEGTSSGYVDNIAIAGCTFAFIIAAWIFYILQAYLFIRFREWRIYKKCFSINYKEESDKKEIKEIEDGQKDSDLKSNDIELKKSQKSIPTEDNNEDEHPDTNEEEGDIEKDQEEEEKEEKGDEEEEEEEDKSKSRSSLKKSGEMKKSVTLNVSSELQASQASRSLKKSQQQSTRSLNKSQQQSTRSLNKSQKQSTRDLNKSQKQSSRDLNKSQKRNTEENSNLSKSQTQPTTDLEKSQQQDLKKSGDVKIEEETPKLKKKSTMKEAAKNCLIKSWRIQVLKVNVKTKNEKKARFCAMFQVLLAAFCLIVTIILMANLDSGKNGYYWVDLILNALLIVGFILFAIKLPSLIYVPMSKEEKLERKRKLWEKKRSKRGLNTPPASPDNFVVHVAI